MIATKDLQELRSSGASDKDILQFYADTNPQVAKTIKELHGEAESDILDFLTTQTPRTGRLIEFEGRQIEVPHDATDDEISSILSESPADQRFPHPGNPQVPQDTSFTSAIGYGVSNALGGLGNTLDVVGNRIGTDTGAAASLKALARSVRPENYQPAGASLKAFSPSTWSNVPRAAVEALPGLAASLGAGAVGTAVAGPVGGVAGFMASSAGQNYGNTALEIAQNNGRSTPTDGDLAQAAGVSLAEAALDRVGAGGVISAPVRGSVGSVLKGAGKAVVNAGRKEALTEMGQEAIHQAGTTLGTDKGMSLNPEYILNAGMVGGTLGAGLRGARGAQEVGASAATTARMSHIGADEGALAARALADTGIDLSDVRKTPDAIQRAETTLFSHLTAGRKALRKAQVAGLAPELDPATGNFSSGTVTEAMPLLRKGETLTGDHMANLEDRLGGTVEGAATLRTIKAINALNKVKQLGTLDRPDGSKPGRFVGGLTPRLSLLDKVTNTRLGRAATGAAGLGGAVYGALAGTGGLLPMVAGSPAALTGLGAVVGGHAALRGIDALTGARNPVQGLIDTFGTDYPLPSAPIVRKAQQASRPSIESPAPAPFVPEALSEAVGGREASSGRDYPPTPPLPPVGFSGDLRGIPGGATNSRRAIAAMQARRKAQEYAESGGDRSFNHRGVNILVPSDVRNLERYKAGAVARQDAISAHIEYAMNLSGLSDQATTAIAGIDVALRNTRSRAQAREAVVRLLSTLDAKDRTLAAPLLLDDGFLNIWTKPE